MALIPCFGRGKEISDKAVTHPNGGTCSKKITNKNPPFPITHGVIGVEGLPPVKEEVTGNKPLTVVGGPLAILIFFQ